MEGEAFLALMRLTLNENKVVAHLACTALKLAKGIREAEARAEMAEAALEAERAKTAHFADALRQGAGMMIQPVTVAPKRSVKITRQTSVVFEIQ